MNNERDFAAAIRGHAREHPDRIAYRFLVSGDVDGPVVTWTYGRLIARAEAVGTALRRQVPTGSRVVLLYPAGPEFMAGFLGCVLAGMVAVPVACSETEPFDRVVPRLGAVITDCGAAVVLTDAAWIPPGRAAFADRRWIATEMLPDAVGGGAVGDGVPAGAVGQVAFLQYTSGSTRSPKGVVVTQANLVHNLRAQNEAWGLDSSVRAVSWLPNHHDMGLIAGLCYPVWLGGTATLLSPAKFAERPARWPEAMSEYGGTFSAAPDFAYGLCARKSSDGMPVRDLDLSSWRIAVNGAEPVRRQSMRRFAEAFQEAGFRAEAFRPAYGLAEATLFVSAPSRFELDAASDPAQRAFVSCGSPAADTEIAIVDPQGLHRLEDGRVGEIWLRGPSNAVGYWNDAELTGATFLARTSDSIGPYLRTGDLGFVAEGELFVVGRLKELIIVAGVNHYPQDLEYTVEQAHPAIRAGGVVAFGVDGIDGIDRIDGIDGIGRANGTEGDQGTGTGGTDGLGEQAAVVAELVDGFEGDPALVAAAVRRAVRANHGISLHAVEFVAARTVPKTSSGKVRRRETRDRFVGGLLTPHAPGPDPVAIIGMGSVGEGSPRMLLEVAFETLEDAKLPPERTAGTATGVFVGVPTGDYARFSMAANRISYTLDFRGPSLMIDTSGSSSLVAVHFACASILSGESEMALAGGEGDGLLLLKSLSRALADGDRVYAVVRGSAVTHDGRSKGPTEAGAQAHTEVSRQVSATAGVAANRVRYVESGTTGGVARLAKLALALHRRGAPGPWPEGEGPLVGVVNSFGVGGTNVQVVLEEVPGAAVDAQPEAAVRPLSLSLSLNETAEVDRPLVRIEGQTDFPLTFNQERILFADTAEATRVIVQHGLVDGPIDIAALEQALRRLTEVHEGLTTVFVRAQDGKTVRQRLAGPVAPVLDFADLVAEPQDSDELRAALEKRLMVVERPFDPFDGPMYRMALTRIGDQQHVLSVALDHLIADSWSMGVVFQDLVRAYESVVAGSVDELEAPPLRLVDYAQWERTAYSGPGLDVALARWRRTLEQWPEPRLPFVRRREADVPIEARVAVAEVWSVALIRLEELARSTATDVPTLVLTAFLLAVAEAAGTDRVAVATRVAGRDRPGLERTLGFLATSRLIAVDFAGCASRRERLLRVRAAVLAASDEQGVSLSQYAYLAGTARDREPYRVALNHLPDVEAPAKLGEAAISLLPRRSVYALDRDIVLFARTTLGPALRLSFAYTGGIVDDEGARRLAAAVADQLTALAENPDGA
ncbi:AMP-binding protein [Catenulispora yoronensis]|uniref:AMP-binding protein n=1 Tax=Catenulispora yoronensis TaxID=450799 RepID=UPI0031E45B6D